MKNFTQAIKYGVPALALMAAGAANAAITLPASIDTVLGELQDAGVQLGDKVWPYMLGILGAFILLRLGKKFISKIG
ncbi:major coat protein [Aeromonas hydrophila]